MRCALCEQPFEAYFLLRRNIKVWVHEPPQLHKCKAIKFDAGKRRSNFVESLLTTHKNMTEGVKREERRKKAKFGNSRRASYE